MAQLLLRNIVFPGQPYMLSTVHDVDDLDGFIGGKLSTGYVIR